MEHELPLEPCGSGPAPLKGTQELPTSGVALTLEPLRDREEPIFSHGAPPSNSRARDRAKAQPRRRRRPMEGALSLDTPDFHFGDAAYCGPLVGMKINPVGFLISQALWFLNKRANDELPLSGGSHNSIGSPTYPVFEFYDLHGCPQSWAATPSSATDARGISAKIRGNSARRRSICRRRARRSVKAARNACTRGDRS